MTRDRLLLAALIAALSASAATGCAAAPSDGDDESAASTEDALTGGVVEGTPEAAAVLRVANEKTATELRVSVGLGEKPATNILAYRLGPDMTAGTADDRTFTTLASLDRITWVNSREFRAMLAWAKANGWLVPTPPPSDLGCAGADLTSAEVLPLFAPGATSARLGSFVVDARTRECTGPTGCTPWVDAPDTVKPAARGGTTVAELVDGTGAVGVSFRPFRGDPLVAAAPLGAPVDASALAGLFDDATGFVYDGGSLKRSCGALRATKKEALDGVRTKETEVVLRAVHATSGGFDSSFATARKVTFTCNQHRSHYAYTCQGRSEYDQIGAAEATVQLSTDGKTFTFTGDSGLATYSSDFDGTYTFDARGRVDAKPEINERTAASIFVQRSDESLVVGFDYAWGSGGNWCGASTTFAYRCLGVVAAE